VDSVAVAVTFIGVAFLFGGVTQLLIASQVEPHRV
jgi:hypothetical protein